MLAGLLSNRTLLINRYLSHPTRIPIKHRQILALSLCEMRNQGTYLKKQKKKQTLLIAATLTIFKLANTTYTFTILEPCIPSIDKVQKRRAMDFEAPKLPQTLGRECKSFQFASTFFFVLRFRSLRTQAAGLPPALGPTHFPRPPPQPPPLLLPSSRHPISCPVFCPSCGLPRPTSQRAPSLR